MTGDSGIMESCGAEGGGGVEAWLDGWLQAKTKGIKLPPVVGQPRFQQAAKV